MAQDPSDDLDDEEFLLEPPTVWDLIPAPVYGLGGVVVGFLLVIVLFR